MFPLKSLYFYPNLAIAPTAAALISGSSKYILLLMNLIDLLGTCLL